MTDGGYQLEVVKPEVDSSGYDVIIEANKIVRHVQLKASYIGGRTSRQRVYVKLAYKPSDCVIWIYFDENSLDLALFYFIGGEPGDPLPPIHETEIAWHTKGDQDCYKSERPNIRELNKGNFTRYKTIIEI